MSREKEQKKRWAKVPHLFSKIIVSICISMGLYYSQWAMEIVEKTEADPSPTLAIILGFFGGELLFLCLKTIKGDKNE